MNIITSSKFYSITFIVMLVFSVVAMYIYRSKRYAEYTKFKKWLEIFTELPFKIIYYITIIYLLLSIYQVTVTEKCGALNALC